MPRTCSISLDAIGRRVSGATADSRRVDAPLRSEMSEGRESLCRLGQFRPRDFTWSEKGIKGPRPGGKASALHRTRTLGRASRLGSAFNRLGTFATHTVVSACRSVQSCARMSEGSSKVSRWQPASALSGRLEPMQRGSRSPPPSYDLPSCSA